MKKYVIICLLSILVSAQCMAKTIETKELREVKVALESDNWNSSIVVEYQQQGGGYVYCFTLDERNGWSIKQLMPVGNYICINKFTKDGVVSSEESFSLTTDYDLVVSVSGKEVSVADTQAVDDREVTVNFFWLYLVFGIAVAAGLVIILLCIRR